MRLQPGYIQAYASRATILARGYTCGTLAMLVMLLAGCKGESKPEDASPTLPDAAVSLFTDVTRAAGLGDFRHKTGASGQKWFPETMGAGGGFADYNGDGWQDIFLVAGAAWPPREAESGPALLLYQNRGDGTFTDATKTAGLDAIRAYGMGVTLADYDNDGDPDVFFTTLHENMLLRNENGFFQDVTAQAGLAAADEWSTAALFFDADRDGFLDLFVGNYVRWSSESDIFCTLNGKDKSYCTPEEYTGVPPRFYRNNGNGTFSEQTDWAGFRPAPGKALGAAMLDYNQDGWIDLAVSNDQQRDLLYENQGDGSFVERGVLSGIAFNEEGKARAGMGIDAGVVDASGEETIFIGNFSNEMIGVFRHQNDGFFVDRAALSQIGYPSLLTLTFGLLLVDADLDGDLDLLATNGHVQEEIEDVRDNVNYRQQPQLFLNDGNGRFDLHRPVPARDNPLELPIVARGAAYADFDLDGDQDILVTENGGPAYLWRNNTRSPGKDDGPYWLRVELEGAGRNRDAIGAVVEAAVAGKRIVRRVTTGSSYLSHAEQAIVLGLGSHPVMDTLRIHWPDGRADEHLKVSAGQRIRIVAGSTGVYPVPAPSPRVP